MKIYNRKRSKQVTAFLLSLAMTAAAVPSFGTGAFAAELAEPEAAEIALYDISGTFDGNETEYTADKTSAHEYEPDSTEFADTDTGSQDNALVIDEETVLTSDVECDELVLNAKLDMNGHKLTVNSSINVEKYIDINAGTLTVNGDILHKGNDINVNNGTLNVNGNYYMQDKGLNNAGEVEYYNCRARLLMTSEHDIVNISGNVIMHSCDHMTSFSNTGDSKFDAFSLGKNAVLSIGGDIWSDCGFCKYSWGSEQDEIGTVILNGKGDQYIHFEGFYSYGGQFEVFFPYNSLANLNVKNPENREIVFDGYVNIRRLLSDVNIKSENCSVYNADLNKHNMVINGDCMFHNDRAYYATRIDINAGTLTVNGNVSQQSGKVIVNNGTLNINGNYVMEDTSENNVGETIYNECYATLTMTEKYDTVNVSGDFTAHNVIRGKITLDYGVFTVGGDIWCDKGFEFDEYNDPNDNIKVKNNKVVLNGSGTQRVYVSGISKGSSARSMNRLEVTDPDKRSIIWNGVLSVKELASDISIKTDGLELSNLSLDHNNVTIDGDVEVIYDTDLNGGNLVINGDMTISGAVNINGGTLTVNGDLLHNERYIMVNNGHLIVNGNYTMERTSENNVGDITYEICGAVLCWRKNTTRSISRVIL